MSILRTLARDFQFLFPLTDHGQERFRWFVLTLQAILVPITVSRTSNLLRAIETLFGVSIAEWRYYTFMASVKLPWEWVWEALWRAIPSPLVAGRLLLALDDSINAKTGKHIFACQRTFDHAAKTNQSRWPWAQTIVTVGLLKPIHGRWSCIPLAFGFYLRRETLRRGCLRVRRKAVVFADKFAQAVALIARLGAFFGQVPVLVVTDSWFGNNGLLKPLRERLGQARSPALAPARECRAVCAWRAPRRARPGARASTASASAMPPTWPRRCAPRRRPIPCMSMARCARWWPPSGWSCSRACAVRSVWCGSIARPSGWRS